MAPVVLVLRKHVRAPLGAGPSPPLPSAAMPTKCSLHPNQGDVPACVQAYADEHGQLQAVTSGGEVVKVLGVQLGASAEAVSAAEVKAIEADLQKEIPSGRTCRPHALSPVSTSPPLPRTSRARLFPAGGGG
jgi:hypothetical protein